MNIPSAPNPILNNARSGPADMLSAVSAMEGVAPTSASDSAAQRSLIATLAGRTITALVVSRADDGHGIIDVDGLRLTVAAQLPAAGSSVTLRFPGNARNTTGSGATAATGALARLSSALLGETEAAGEVDRAGSTLVALGAGAKSLNRFAETPLEPLQLGKMGSDIEDTGNWSQELARMLRDSGNFYESHLAAFTRGGYKLEDIRQEPQAMAGRVLEASVPNPENAAQTPAHAAATAASATLANAANDNGGVPDSLRQILREQLHTLETQSMPFSMEAWPGQDADLVIQRDNSNGTGTSQDGGWKTSLKLNLPELGQVNATLTLSGDRLWLDLSAASGSTGTLDGASGSLAHAMHAAGIQLVRTRVVDQGDEGSGTGGMSGAGSSGTGSTGSTGASVISIAGPGGAGHSGVSHPGVSHSGAGTPGAGNAAGANSAHASGARNGGITATTPAAPRYAAALASAAYAQTRALP